MPKRKKRGKATNGGAARKNFSKRDRARVLQWCDRHCCLCDKQCGIHIEIHHIDENHANNRIDNALPLCYECHGKVAHYNTRHPRGRKYRETELKSRRDQVYEKHTRHLVPPIDVKIVLGEEKKPGMVHTDVRCVLTNAGAVRAKVKVNAVAIRQCKRRAIKSPYYNGKWPWHLNPAHQLNGHFKYPWKHDDDDDSDEPRIRVDLVVIDEYEFEHQLHPIEYVYNNGGTTWVFEPCPIHERPEE